MESNVFFANALNGILDTFDYGSQSKECAILVAVACVNDCSKRNRADREGDGVAGAVSHHVSEYPVPPVNSKEKAHAFRYRALAPLS
jgi:hypothetical protein